MHTPRPHAPTRRTFLRHVGVAGLTLPLAAPRLVRAASPNGVVRHASIGVGGMGWSDIHQFRSHPNLRIVAVCDIDRRNLDKALAGPAEGARAFADYRRLFDDFAGEFDSVSVTIPDHMHAPVALRALDAGKHLYCQKPMTKWLAETRAVEAKAAATQVVTQLGIQNHARTEFRLARWALREGHIGKVDAVHAWSNKDWGGAVPMPETRDAPDHVDWNLWLGVAPRRPYAPGYHPNTWRNWTDFGCGLLGDMACHVLDSPMHALELGPLRTVESLGPAPTAQNWPDRATVRFTFDGNARTAGDTLAITWYDGATTPPEEVASLYPHRLPQTGSMVIGDKGAVLIPHVAAPRLLPAEDFADVRFPKLDPAHHYHAFVDAIGGGAATEAPLDGYGGRLVETVLAGTIAQRCPDTVLKYDADAGRFDHDAANDWLIRPYRDGFGTKLTAR